VSSSYPLKRWWSLVTTVGSSANETFYCSSMFGNLEKTDDVIRRGMLYSELRKDEYCMNDRFSAH